MRRMSIMAAIVLAAAGMSVPLGASAVTSAPGSPPPLVAGQVEVGAPLHLALNVHVPVMGKPRHTVRVNGTWYSTNWSGYVDLPGKTFQSVAARFTIPKLSSAAKAECEASAAVDSLGEADSSYWVGLDGWTSPTVEQTGIDQYCVSNGTGLYAWYEMYPLNPVVYTGVNPGDQIYVSVVYDASSHNYVLHLADLTNGGYIITRQALPSGYPITNTSAEVITEDPGASAAGGLYLANFGTAGFTGAGVRSSTGYVGGFHSSSVWSGNNKIIENYYANMATPSGLDSTGGTFSDVFGWPY
jgi:hypothetical protein